MKPINTYILTIIVLLCQPLQSYAEEIVINAVGDVMLAGKWAPLLRKKGYDYPFSGVRKVLASADINCANLESPIAADGEEYTDKKYRFRADPTVAGAIRAAGFNLVTLANNHSMDFGGDALAETRQHLSDKGIASIGAGKNISDARRMALFTIKSKRLAFLAYSLTQPFEFFAGLEHPGTAPGYEKLVTADIASARKQADYVIVSFHWGKEALSTVQQYQQSMARKSIEAGADVIIGHHPHVLQGIEHYRNGLIFYSLGNFVFASKSTISDISVIIRLHFNGELRSAEILPLDVLHQRVGFQPQLLTGTRGEDVIRTLNDLSRPFRTEIQHTDSTYFIIF
ncbi:MAG: CapA family protein [Desulfuromonadaceae bacterium]|nr:CapA family protein [Desulfuromonadaceae bacterium]